MSHRRRGLDRSFSQRRVAGRHVMDRTTGKVNSMSKLIGKRALQPIRKLKVMVN
jgi:hypothetical protein